MNDEESTGAAAPEEPGRTTAGPEAGRSGEAQDGQPPASKPAARHRRDAVILRAYRTGQPIEGRVERVIKGGYEVAVRKSRGFCPHSQMDLHRVESPEEYVGKTFAFRVTQVRHGGEDLVVSRRALLEEGRTEEAKAVRATLIEGAVMQGRVARLADFGAFVDLGAGVTGLVHVSELSHSRVGRASDAVHEGEWVSVRITKLDETAGRISLSIRQAHDDPWQHVGEKYAAGSRTEGKVVRLADFGAFVELERGVEALAPAREFPPAAEDWRRGLEPGTSLAWRVLSVDVARRRIAIVPDSEWVDRGLALDLTPGSRIKGRVQNVEKFGVFVWLAPGKIGLVPTPWTGASRGADLAKEFPRGREVEVEIVEVGDGGKKIRLTMDPDATRQAAEQARAGEERRAAEPAATRGPRAAEPPAPEPASPPASFGTSLGDALKSALEKRNRG